MSGTARPKLVAAGAGGAERGSPYRVEFAAVDRSYLAKLNAKRSERIFVACDCVLSIAAAFFGISASELRRRGRCADGVSRIRQIAMYAAHVVLRISMADVGKGFGRDRTTVMHACHTIEDLRDDGEFDAIVAKVERLVAAAFVGRDGFSLPDRTADPDQAANTLRAGDAN